MWRYRGLIRLLSPLIVAYTLWRTGKDGGRRYLIQRLALYPKPRGSARSPGLIWIHAASVGEIFTVLPLIKSLKQPLLVTTTTPTGAAVLQQEALPHVQHRYLPVDLSGACQRFFDSMPIDQGWIVETEIWPWLYARAKSARIPLCIINARLSDRTSSHADGFLATTFQQALSGVKILSRSRSDAERYAQLGAAASSIRVVGNLKYANPASGNNSQIHERLIDRPYVLAASTHDDEELQLAIEWCRQYEHHVGGVIFVIAPRHPERGAAIQKQLHSQGIASALRSSNEDPDITHPVYIADTLGELQAWYAYAIAGFIGGSLIKRGGHNLLEAARLGCPVVTGPHTFNFDDIVQAFHDHQALTIAEDAQQVVVFLCQVLEDPDAYASTVERARTQAKISEGVLENYLDALLPD
ncbi:MAG: 3-deoxy-D-manno-octulosonic acid transferase [Granulosicoccus sp.]